MSCVLTDGVGANGVRVHTEQWDGDKRPVSPQAQHSVAQLQGYLMFVCVALVEVDVCGRALGSAAKAW